MGQRLAAFTVAIAALATPAWASDGPPKSAIVRSVLALFEAQQGMCIDEFLARSRPAPLDRAGRDAVIASLPTQGELSAKPAERLKIEGARPVLEYHGRWDVVTFKVIDVGHAFVGLHARSVLLASRDALWLVGNEEFAALVAHELAHEHVWTEYRQAMEEKDHQRMQELELRCDGIAVLTLRRLGIDPERLVSAVQKATRFNQHRRMVASAGDYVSLSERVAYIRAMATMAWRGADMTAGACSQGQ